jgi:Ca-activated chloride channel family protein
VLNENATWSSPAKRAVAAAFLSYAADPTARRLPGRRLPDGNRAPGPALTSANGVAEKITALPRAILLPESVQHAAASWTAVTRPTNLLLVFDTSGSMGEVVPGAGQTRLDLTKAAAQGALALLDDSAQVGVWNFSTVAAGKDYQIVLPLTR